jgi:hypothetical protein
MWEPRRLTILMDLHSLTLYSFTLSLFGLYWKIWKFCFNIAVSWRSVSQLRSDGFIHSKGSSPALWNASSVQQNLALPPLRRLRWAEQTLGSFVIRKSRPRWRSSSVVFESHVTRSVKMVRNGSVGMATVWAAGIPFPVVKETFPSTPTVLNLSSSRTPWCNFFPTLYPQSCWCIIQVIHSL